LPSKSIFNRSIIEKVYNPRRGGGFMLGLFRGEGVEKSFVGLMSIWLGRCGHWSINGLICIWCCRIPFPLYWKASFQYIGKTSKISKEFCWFDIRSYEFFGVRGMKGFLRQRFESGKRFLKRYN
jgi:hypothetical protein